MSVHPTHDPFLQAQADRDSDLTRHGYTVPHEDRDLSSPSPSSRAPVGAVAYSEPGGGTPPPPPDAVELAALMRGYAAWLPVMSGLRARLLFAALDVEKGNV